MHLIHALQACYIFSVPSSIPRDLYQQFAELKIPDLPQPEALTLPSHRSKPSLQVTSSTSSRGSRISPAGSSTGSSSPKPSDREDKWDWDVTPQQKQEFDNYFYKLDPERKGYVDEDTAASFMLAYQLPPGDLAHIWYVLVHFCRRSAALKGFYNVFSFSMAGVWWPSTAMITSLSTSLRLPCTLSSENPLVRSFRKHFRRHWYLLRSAPNSRPRYLQHHPSPPRLTRVNRHRHHHLSGSGQ